LAFPGKGRYGGSFRRAVDPHMSDRPPRLTRPAFRVFRPIATRWMDNDVYGHVNNVVYYSYFDTAVNGYLIDKGLLDFRGGALVGYVVETGCTFFEPIAFPEVIEAGIAVTSIGRSSVRYCVGIFKAGAERAAAQGHFVHCYVDRATQRPLEIPERMRSVLSGITA
jgi:acyl-CoA thioester hydrolase